MQVNSGLWNLSMPSLRKFLPISYTPSNPPTMSLFRYSSVAMRMYMSMSSALKWVMNGRAEAPPGMFCRIGVSTSVYPCSSKNLRMVRSTVARFTNVCFTPSLTMRST